MIRGERIFVTNVPRKSVQGRDQYAYRLDDGTAISSGRTRSRGISIPFGFIKRGKTLATGLDEMVDNPFYDLELTELNSDLKIGSNWFGKYDSVKAVKMISRQMLYEILDDVSEGTYTSQINTPSMSEVLTDTNMLKDVRRTYLEGFRIYLNEGTNVFDSSTTRGRLAIQVCKNHPKIASNKNDVNESLHEFYIAEEEEGVRETNRKIDTVMEGLQKLGDLFAKYDMFTRYQMGVTLDIIAGDVSDSLVEMNLKNYIWEQKSNKQGSQVERINNFVEMFDLLARDKDRLYIKYMLKQAVNSGIMMIQSGQYIWKSQKGIENLYRLGTSVSKIENMLFNEMEAYDPDSNAEDNVYYRLNNELKSKGIKCK